MSGRPRVHQQHDTSADFDFSNVRVADAKSVSKIVKEPLTCRRLPRMSSQNHTLPPLSPTAARLKCDCT
jgi:hypothetical protein